MKTQTILLSLYHIAKCCNISCNSTHRITTATRIILCSVFCWIKSFFNPDLGGCCFISYFQISEITIMLPYLHVAGKKTARKQVASSTLLLSGCTAKLLLQYSSTDASLRQAEILSLLSNLHGNAMSVSTGATLNLDFYMPIIKACLLQKCFLKSHLVIMSF